MVTGEYPYSECQFPAQIYKKVISVCVAVFKHVFIMLFATKILGHKTRLLRSHSEAKSGNSLDNRSLHSIEARRTRDGLLFYRMTEKQKCFLQVKQLLADDFFTPEEQIGVRIDIKNRENDLNETNNEIQMQLRVFDEKKRTQYKFKENEGLQFAFDVEQDKAEEVVQQMIEQQHIPDLDTRMIIKLIKDKVRERHRQILVCSIFLFCLSSLAGRSFQA